MENQNVAKISTGLSTEKELEARVGADMLLKYIEHRDSSILEI